MDSARISLTTAIHATLPRSVRLLPTIKGSLALFPRHFYLPWDFPLDGLIFSTQDFARHQP